MRVIGAACETELERNERLSMSTREYHEMAMQPHRDRAAAARADMQSLADDMITFAKQGVRRAMTKPVELSQTNVSDAFRLLIDLTDWRRRL